MFLKRSKNVHGLYILPVGMKKQVERATIHIMHIILMPSNIFSYGVDD